MSDDVSYRPNFTGEKYQIASNPISGTELCPGK